MPKRTAFIAAIVACAILNWPAAGVAAKEDKGARGAKDAKATVVKQGNDQLGRGNVSSAIKTFRKLLAEHPDDASVRNGLAMAYDRRVDWLLKRNRIRRALTLLKKVINLCDCSARDYARRYTFLSKLLVSQGRSVEAVQAARSAIGYQPNFFKAHRSLGLAEFERGRFSAGVKAFEAALRIRPKGSHVASMERVLRSARDRKDVASFEQITKAGPAKSKRSSGSGFLVSRKGHILTNAHVVRACKSIEIIGAAFNYSGALIASDDKDDLALIKVPHTQRRVAIFRAHQNNQPGDPVVVVGHPLPSVLGQTGAVTTGVISAMVGPKGDHAKLTITAPVQKGSSGGPVLDDAGQVVGIVVSKLNALRIAKATGDVPQNINFAIKSSLARKFLDRHKVKYRTASRPFGSSPAKIAQAARQYTVLIRCLR